MLCSVRLGNSDQDHKLIWKVFSEVTWEGNQSPPIHFYTTTALCFLDGSLLLVIRDGMLKALAN